MSVCERLIGESCRLMARHFPDPLLWQAVSPLKVAIVGKNDTNCNERSQMVTLFLRLRLPIEAVESRVSEGGNPPAIKRAGNPAPSLVPFRVSFQRILRKEVARQQRDASCPHARALPLAKDVCMRSMTDEQLMHLYQGGDEDAFRELYGRYHHQLEAFVVNTLNALCPAFLTDVADILQTIFTWVHSYRGQFIAGTMVKPWLYSTANRLTRNHIEFETRKRRDFRRSAALEPGYRGRRREPARGRGSAAGP